MTIEEIKTKLNRHGIVNILDVNTDHENWVAFEVRTKNEADIISDSLETMTMFNWHEIHKLSYGNYIVRAEVVS